MIFESFLEEDLCGLGLSIVKEFLSVREVHADVLKVSRGEVTRLLSNFIDNQDNVYCGVEGREKIRENILSLLGFLREEEAEYTYKIMKDFAEREKTKYLESNLIDFMNDLSRERRKLIFNEWQLAVWANALIVDMCFYNFSLIWIKNTEWWLTDWLIIKFITH